MVDLICTDAKGVPFHSTSDCVFDCAWGSGENDFELTLYDGTVLPDRGRVYIDGTEVGGIIDHMKDELTDNVSTVTYSGRSWHGVLDGKVLQPDSGQDYLAVSGAVDKVLSSLVSRVDLASLFKVRSDSVKNIPKYQFERYCTAYDGIRKMLAANGLKLMFEESDGTIWLYATPIVDHADTVDSDLVDFSITKDYRRTNHMIGLGKGDLRNRLVVHYYADASGNVSTTRTFGGVDEIAAVYDYSSAEQSELDKQTKKQLQDLQGTGAVEVTAHDGLLLDVGDKVAGRDNLTGLSVSASVLKKIVKLSDGVLSVSYEVGDAASSKTSYSNYSGSSSSSSSGASSGSLVAGRGLSISGNTINAEVAQSDLDAVKSVADEANKTASGFSSQIGTANQTAEAAKNTADAAKATADAAQVGMMTDAERQKLAGIADNANAYTLPVASTGTLGGVKVDGSTIVVSADGVISAHVGASSGGSGSGSQQVVFPVGYVVRNTTGVDPSVDFGGQWRQLPSLDFYTFERIG